MKRLFIIALVLLLFSACEDKSKNVKPSRLLTEKEMIDIMTDVQIIEADINYNKSNGVEVGDKPKVYYRQLFEHYGITDSIFNENMRYYTYEPETMERIMDSVTLRLTKEQSKKGNSQ